MKTNKLAVYQAKDGAIELRKDAKSETIWASKQQIAKIFGIDRSVVSRHIASIFKDGELDQKVVCAKNAHTTRHGAIRGKTQTNQLDFYNLDIILAVGYRTKSSVAIEFRKWATKTLKEHITQGFTLNTKRLKQNQKLFEKTLQDLKLLSKDNQSIAISDVLDLVKAFSHTWFSLGQYDKENFPKKGNKKTIQITADELKQDLQKLKQNLIEKNEATDIFANERQKESLQAIVGNVFQTVFGEDVYPTLEEKAAHLLYFLVKNHPFTDGNKRSGAFAFVWFLQKAGLNFEQQINPETLTTLTVLIAESNPKEKEKMIGLVLLILNSEQK